jgi:hypothetical protein
MCGTNAHDRLYLRLEIKELYHLLNRSGLNHQTVSFRDEAFILTVLAMLTRPTLLKKRKIKSLLSYFRGSVVLCTL